MTGAATSPPPSSESATRAPRGRLVLFACGDFAFNLYWQSVMLFLLFYYTDAVRLPIATAALTYMVASIWDGIVNFAAGIVIDRRRADRGFRRYLLVGAIPLGLSFLLMYLPPPVPGGWAVAAVLGGHLLFRTAYAMVNVPYLAMSARISLDSGDRALIAGMRMLFGTAAFVVVTLGTVRIGGWITGGADLAQVYFAAAAVFAVVGAAILMLVGSGTREVPVDATAARMSLRASLASLAHNRAFLTLNAAAIAMIVASTVLTKTVLYYYKYYLGDVAAGESALASMGLIGVVAVPLWTLGCRWLGGRVAWFAASGLGVALLVGFALVDVRGTALMTLFLMGMQVALMGHNIAFWAMLPDTIEYGERSTGLRVEGTVFGLAALLQRASIGAATGLLGIVLGAIGYAANVDQPPATLAGLRWTVALIPLAFLLLSVVMMALNPLRHGTHARILADLAQRRAARRPG